MSASPGATEATDNTEHSVVPEQHGQAEQERCPTSSRHRGSTRAAAVRTSTRTGDTIGASEPGEASSTVKDPSEWVTGDEAMTGAQRSYLETLAREAGEQLPADLTKAQASEHIDRLQAQTGRGQ